jgi:hypothetical protein
MITFNNIVKKFEEFCTDHFFIKTFSYGSPSDVDLEKFEQYPLLHLVYTGGDYNSPKAKTYNLEVYILSLPPSEADKVTYQKENISDAEQVAEDILADIQNGGNIFQFGFHYDLINASVTPLEEEKSNALAGCLLDLAISVPYTYDSCNAPLTGVEPEGSDTPSFKARGLLRVREEDGSPDVLSVATINVPNGTLTDDGEGEITLTFGGGGDADTAEKVHFPVRNDEGATIPAGTPIYTRGEIGGSDRILVGIADASDPAKMPAIGIAETELTTNGATKDGYAIMTGTYNTNLSGFTGLAEGDILYVSNSGGGLAQTKPTGTYLIQNVGIVLKTNGTILQGFQVSCIGRTNDVPNLPDGKFFIGSATNTQASAYGLPTSDPTNGETLVYNSTTDAFEGGYPTSTGQVSNWVATSTKTFNVTGTGLTPVTFGSVLAGDLTFDQDCRAGWNMGMNINGSVMLAAPVGITSTIDITITVKVNAPVGSLAQLQLTSAVGWFTAPTLNQPTIVGNGTETEYQITTTVTGESRFWQLANSATISINVLVNPGTIVVKPQTIEIDITHA